MLMKDILNKVMIGPSWLSRDDRGFQHNFTSADSVFPFLKQLSCSVLFCAIKKFSRQYSEEVEGKAVTEWPQTGKEPKALLD